ncbi:hypothetical protein AHAS_Ahas10G0088600 [Arachis hypogaea]
MKKVQYLKDYQTFVNTARYWTEKFAKPTSLGIEDKADFLPLRKLTSWTLVQVVEVFANSKLHFSNAWKEYQPPLPPDQKEYSGSARTGDGSIRRDQVGQAGQNTQLVHKGSLNYISSQVQQQHLVIPSLQSHE